MGALWYAVIGILAGTLIGWAWPAGGVDVEMTPAACYTVAGEVVGKNGSHFGLVFNQCEPAFKWYKMPEPPDGDA